VFDGETSNHSLTFADRSTRPSCFCVQVSSRQTVPRYLMSSNQPNVARMMNFLLLTHHCNQTPLKLCKVREREVSCGRTAICKKACKGRERWDHEGEQDGVGWILEGQHEAAIRLLTLVTVEAPQQLADARQVYQQRRIGRVHIPLLQMPRSAQSKPRARRSAGFFFRVFFPAGYL
jgi:hypothetical protein